MPELTFVFGPNKSFFFDCPKSWKFFNLSPTLRQLFNSSMSPEWRVAQPYCLALAPQVTKGAEPVWYLGCKSVGGQDKLLYSQTYFDFNYPDLSRWVKSIPNGPRNCFVTFGPGLSYFASAPGNGSIWAGIPGDLSDKIQKAYDTPNCVSLGMNNAWFVMWPDGYYSWKFYGSYGSLDNILKAAEPRTVSHLAISPYNKEHYFVAFKDRTVKYNFIGAPEWMPQMQEVFAEWQNEIMQRQAYQYQQSQHVSGPTPPPPPQWKWNQYPQTPSSGYSSPMTPSTPLPAYSTPVTSPLSSCNQYGAAPPSQKPMPTQPMLPRSTSTDKKRRSIFKRDTVAPVAGAMVAKAAVTVATEGSQTCVVM